jgi:hypothetical protein
MYWNILQIKWDKNIDQLTPYSNLQTALFRGWRSHLLKNIWVVSSTYSVFPPEDWKLISDLSQGTNALLHSNDC